MKQHPLSPWQLSMSWHSVVWGVELRKTSESRILHLRITSLDWASSHTINIKCTLPHSALQKSRGISHNNSLWHNLLTKGDRVIVTEEVSWPWWMNVEMRVWHREALLPRQVDGPSHSVVTRGFVLPSLRELHRWAVTWSYCPSADVRQQE